MIRAGAQGAGELLVGGAPGSSNAKRQRGVLEETGHRPWRLPNAPWFMGQTWIDLLFAHWRVDPKLLQAVMPPQLSPQTFDGSAWLGVTPFVVHGLRLRGTWPMPFLSRFPEINVRTYVSLGEKPGIYFFSLDADSRSAVLAARRSYRLPYFRSEIDVTAEGEAVHYRARRVSGDGPAAEFDATYSPEGAAHPAEPGTLAHWLTERYCLYPLDDAQRVCRADIHHPPWPLQPARAEIELNTMTAGIGLSLEEEPLLHYSGRQDVVLWTIEPV